jgi:hypothetical protein
MTLGFIENTTPLIYVRDGGWHFWDKETEQKTPIKARSLKCYILDIDIYDTNRIVKGKSGNFLMSNLLVQADRNYKITAGLDTCWTKSMLCSLYLLNDIQLSSILAINMRPSTEEEKVIFCNIYDGVKKSQEEKEVYKNKYAEIYAQIKEGGESEILIKIQEIKDRLSAIKATAKSFIMPEDDEDAPF